MQVKKTFRLLFLMLLVSTLAACNTKEVTLTDADQGKTIELEVGQVANSSIGKKKIRDR